ncbi:MAG: hypothetical protein LBG46_02825 [Elusimicrobiota bacterium]|nr:hypothetical protein [Elusimicrobiota bacterium]
MKNKKWNNEIKVSLKFLLAHPDELLLGRKEEIAQAAKRGYKRLNVATGAFCR